jgi:hypothetical protein
MMPDASIVGFSKVIDPIEVVNLPSGIIEIVNCMILFKTIIK